jgi:hypothetical protein
MGEDVPQPRRQLRAGVAAKLGQITVGLEERLDGSNLRWKRGSVCSRAKRWSQGR